MTDRDLASAEILRRSGLITAAATEVVNTLAYYPVMLIVGSSIVRESKDVDYYLLTEPGYISERDEASVRDSVNSFFKFHLVRKGIHAEPDLVEIVRVPQGQNDIPFVQQRMWSGNYEKPEYGLIAVTRTGIIKYPPLVDSERKRTVNIPLEKPL